MTTKGRLIGLIPARGGSKGIPRKNLRLLNGKPLIAHAIAVGKSCSALDRVVVTTDDQEIADVAVSFGADVPFLRPALLAKDETPMMPVLQHAVQQCEQMYGDPVRAVVLLDATSPLRIKEDVEGAIALFDSSDADAVISGAPAHRSPHFNMVGVDNGWARLLIPSEKPVGRRQDAPAAFDLDTTVWIYSRRAIMELGERMPAKTKLYSIPKSRSHDLDTEDDWRYIEFLMAGSPVASHGRPAGFRA